MAILLPQPSKCQDVIWVPPYLAGCVLALCGYLESRLDADFLVDESEMLLGKAREGAISMCLSLLIKWRHCQYFEGLACGWGSPTGI